jgi:hypothetical protein
VKEGRSEQHRGDNQVPAYAAGFVSFLELVLRKRPNLPLRFEVAATSSKGLPRFPVRSELITVSELITRRKNFRSTLKVGAVLCKLCGFVWAVRVFNF